jgi:hypothetical protein
MDGLILIAELIGIYAIVRRLYKLWKDRTPFTTGIVVITLPVATFLIAFI